jgi:hypothetical protein
MLHNDDTGPQGYIFCFLVLGVERKSIEISMELWVISKRA